MFPVVQDYPWGMFPLGNESAVPSRSPRTRPSRDVLHDVVNPLMGTLKPQSNGPLYSNTVIGTLGVDRWAVAVTFGTARRGGLQRNNNRKICNASEFAHYCRSICGGVTANKPFRIFRILHFDRRPFNLQNVTEQ